MVDQGARDGRENDDTDGDAGRGLTSAEAARLLAEVGPNEVAERRRNPVLAFLGRYWGPMPWLLELAAALALAVGHATEALVILVLLTVNAVVGTVQSGSADRAMRLLRRDLQARVTCLRDGAWGEVAARELVPGDVVSLAIGEVAPADCRVLSGEAELDLSSLTGESLPRGVAAGDEAPSGAVVTRGKVRGVVIATGERAALGRAAALVRDARPRSRQQELLFLIVRYMMYVGVAASAVVAAWAFALGRGLVAVASLVVTFLMGAVPVALPAVLSIVQAASALALSRRGVLVTRLDSVEDAASIDVFCLDKTGTITENRLEVSELVPLGATGPDELAALAALSADPAGAEPIDAACLRLGAPAAGTGAAASAGLNAGGAAASGPGGTAPAGLAGARRLSHVPFDPATRRTETVAELADGTRLVVAKGAPRTMLDLCAGLSPAERADALERVGRLSARGLRAVMVAVSTAPARAAAPGGAADGADEPRRFSPAGILGLADPPRADAADLVGELRALGIRCLMLTGDDVAIAREVAGRVGIGLRVRRAQELRGLPREEQLALVEASDGFAEVLPEDKHRIVGLLQEAGHSVGMTGDGVNDAPALRQAELGCAVAGACDVARASASAVLTRPGLAGLVDAVRESRRAYQRMLTWVVNKVVKVMEVVALFVTAYLATGEMPVTLLGMSLLVFANDFATMSIATDNVVATDSPNAWDLRSIVLASGGVGALFALEDLALWWAGGAVLGLAPDAAATLALFALVVNSQVRILSVRERGHLWASAPSRTMVAVAALACAGFAVLVTSGAVVPAIGWREVGVVLASCAAGGVAIDCAKVALFRRLGVR